MKRGLHERVKMEQAFTPLSRNAATDLYNDAAIGAAVGIDCQGFEDALVSVLCGLIGATTLDVSVGFADVDDAEDATFALLSGATFAQIVDADDGKNFEIRIKLQDVGRYMFVKTTLGGAVATVYAVAVALGEARVEPVTPNQTINFKDD